MPAPLTLHTYRFTFQALEPIRMPLFAGSTWRGLFGHSLRTLVCVTRQSSCDGCLLADRCVYTRVFEPEQRQHHQSKDKPRPYVFFSGSLQAGSQQLFHRPSMQAGEYFGVDLTLINEANQHLPYIIHAMETAGNRGIGLRQPLPNPHATNQPARLRRGRFQLKQVDTVGAASDANPLYVPGNPLKHKPHAPLAGTAIPPCPQNDELTLNFITPLRQRLRSGMVGPQNFAFAPFFAALLRRMESFTGPHAPPWDYARLMQLAEQVTITDNRLRWQKQKRYSSRQRQTVNLSGMLGQVTFAAPHWQPLWPFLWQGQFLHVGKSACMGLGKYLIYGAETGHFFTKLFETPNFPQRPLQVIDFSAKITP